MTPTVSPARREDAEHQWPNDDAAVVSHCGAYRYRLHRLVDNIYQGRRVLFIMLNPSTADAERDDPTIRRCIGFTRSWECGSMCVVNLFGLRATDPREIQRHVDPVGPCNDDHMLMAIRSVDDVAGIVVCAWGTRGRYLDRDAAVLRLIQSTGVTPHVLGVTRDGHPKHPLYIPQSQIPRPWDQSFL